MEIFLKTHTKTNYFLVDVEAFFVLVDFLDVKEELDFLQEDLLHLQESCSTAKDQKYSF